MYISKVERLLLGETIVSRELGSSMLPLIHSRQAVELTPIAWEAVEVRDIVYCKVRGRFYTHLVKAKNEKRGCLIGNNRGRINGWTKKVYGKVTQIFTEKEINKK